MRHRALVEGGPELRRHELAKCKRDVRHFINTWGWTFDPRNAEGDSGLPSLLPFDLWPRQMAFADWLDERLAEGSDGLAEKSRDSGFTWECVAYAVHRWRFFPGFTTSFASRKQELVDKLGDPDSIFEKVRIFLRYLPPWMLPVGFDSTRHINFMRIINPENDNVIKGEVGDEIGRGGRSTLMVVDEAAFLANAEAADAASSATSRTRIFGSTVNGNGNWFYRKRHGGTLRPDQVFVFDITDNPIHTPQWIAGKEAGLEKHVFASEFLRDYSASVEGICIPGQWVTAAMGIRALLEQHGIVMEPSPRGVAGLDVGGGGKAKSVAVARFGPVVTVPESWGDPDTNETARRALDYAERQRPKRSNGTECKVTLANYDNVGVGHGCLAVMQKGRRNLIGAGVNVGVPPTDRKWPDDRTSKERFANLKAELWFLARERYKRTWEMTQFLLGKPPEEGGHKHPVEELIALPPLTASPDMAALVSQLSTVKMVRNETGKEAIESKSSLAKRGVSSPDHAEAHMLTFAEDNAVEEWHRAFGKHARRG